MMARFANMDLKQLPFKDFIIAENAALYFFQLHFAQVSHVDREFHSEIFF